jgi:archaellum component FlaF (FlaF/FlaG flagellin family)
MTPSPAQPINVANTAWTINHREYGNVTVQFLPNGAAVVQSDKLPTQIQGTWQQNGSSVNVTVPMGSITAQIRGDQLIAEGQAARRLR